MKSPIHRWKQFITYADGRKPHWTFDGKPCWLATGVTDKNGVEIYEGDKVIFGDLEFQGVVVFRNGALGIDFIHFSKQHFTPLVNLIGFTEIEVVGHAEDEQ
ncbi:MAG: hypothetical protein IKP64_00400 [Selenomonadaceae bacterium]|nr:hypothetical protein [Selenomonadaceae bacterium]